MPRTGLVELLGYGPAELKTPPSGWYIDFYVKHPLTGVPTRFRRKLNRVRDLTVRKAYARQVVAELNRKLANGWSPFVEQDAPQAHITLGAALDKFVAAGADSCIPCTGQTYAQTRKKIN